MKKIILFSYIIAGVSYFSFSQNVGIGIGIPVAKLHIKGSTDVSQLIIDANSTQSNTNPLIKLRNSAGADLMWVHSDDTSNVFVGIKSGRVNDVAGGGVNNTFIGRNAGYSNTTGYVNTAIGANAFYSNTTGYYNTAIGMNSLSFNTIGHSNTAIGLNALVYNTTGIFNTVTGRDALIFNTTGAKNSAFGVSALAYNSTGNYNTAGGVTALYSNTEGSYNTATGLEALFYNTTGTHNTANGVDALLYNIAGSYNTACGNSALYFSTGYYNTACGTSALAFNSTGNRNTAIGYGADVSVATLDNATAIGYNALVNANNKVRIGNSGITVLEGQVAYSWPSDGRFKENVKDDVKGLDFIMKLQPVSYNFNRLKYAQYVRENLTPDREKTLVERSQIRSVGFIAQDVEKIIQQTGFISFDAVHAPTNETDNYSLGYAEFVVPLVKAVQEQEQQIETLKKEAEAQKNINNTLQKQIDELKVLLKK